MIRTGTYPFKAPYDQKGVVMKILQAQYELPPNVPFSDSFRDLIHRMFTVNPHQRISIEGIKLHPWFTAALPSALEVCLLPHPFPIVFCDLIRLISFSVKTGRRCRAQPQRCAKHM